MAYRGRVRKGVVVLDDPTALPDGTEVSVRPLKRRATSRKAGKQTATMFERYERFIGAAKGLPPDFSVNHDHYLYGAPKRS